jgi:predicted nuclease of predicted toxin-antitoxin system
MKFFADEDVSRRIVARLRQEGHEVVYVVEKTRSLRDRTILRLALDEGMLVLTRDKDYRRLVLDEQRSTLGVIWLRVADMGRAEQNERVAQVIQEQGERLWHQFTIIYPDRIEMYPLAPSP